MFELSTVLAPVDTSSTSLVALELAEHLSALYKAKLHTAHVVEPIPEIVHDVLFPYAALGEDVSEFEDELLIAAKRMLRLRLGENRGNGTPNTTSISYGRPIESLNQLIMQMSPDLIVMGAHGEGGIRPRHLGSTSTQILETAQRPVLFARQGDRTRHFERVIVATDLSRGCESVLAAASGLSIRSDKPLTVATVLVDPRPYDGGGLLKGALRVDPNAIFARGKRNAEKQFRQIIGTLDVPFPDREAFKKRKIGLNVLFGDPIDELCKLVGRYDAPLLVVGRSKQSNLEAPPLGRVAESIARLVPAHVLVVPV